MSSGVGTLPTIFTSPSMAKAGVINTSKLRIALISVTLSTVASMPNSATAVSAFFVSFSHFWQPVPRT